MIIQIIMLIIIYTIYVYTHTNHAASGSVRHGRADLPEVAERGNREAVPTIEERLAEHL